MSIFPTLAEIQAIAAPIVADAAVQLGSRADIHAIASVRQPDATYKDVPQLSAHDVAVRLKMLTSEQAQLIFGKETAVEMRGSATREDVIEVGNVIEVVSGEFAGQWLRVAKLIEKPLTDSYLLGLVTNPALR